jgi:hypothetical protein
MEFNQSVIIYTLEHVSTHNSKRTNHREETDRAVQKANSLEAAAQEANERADKMEEKQRIFQKKLNEKVGAKSAVICNGRYCKTFATLFFNQKALHLYMHTSYFVAILRLLIVS